MQDAPERIWLFRDIYTWVYALGLIMMVLLMIRRFLMGHRRWKQSNLWSWIMVGAALLALGVML